MTALMLALPKVDSTIEKYVDKQDIVYSGDTWYLKIILILLIKLVAVYMEFFQICFWEPSFKKVLLKLCLIPSLGVLQKCFHKLSEKVIS